MNFNFKWIFGLEPHPPPFSSQKKDEVLVFGLRSTSDDWLGWSMDSNPIHHLSPAKINEMLIFGLHPTSDDQPGWLKDSNPIHHPSPAKKMKCSFLDYVQLLMICWADRWTRTPAATPLQPKKNEMLVFGLHSTSDDQLGWSRDSNPICHPSPTKKNEMLNFGLHLTSDDRLGWSMDSNPIHHPSPAKKMKCLFLDYVQL